MKVLDQAVDYCRETLRKPGDHVVTITFPGLSFPR